MITEETIKEAARRLADRFHPDRIILFGSYARGTADKHSDVDFLVICPVNKDRKKLAYEMDMALWGLGMAKDIILLVPKLRLGNTFAWKAPLSNIELGKHISLFYKAGGVKIHPL